VNLSEIIPEGCVLADLQSTQKELSAELIVVPQFVCRPASGAWFSCYRDTQGFAALHPGLLYVAALRLVERRCRMLWAASGWASCDWPLVSTIYSRTDSPRYIGL